MFTFYNDSITFTFCVSMMNSVKILEMKMYYIMDCNSILLERLTHFLHDWTFFVGGD